LIALFIAFLGLPLAIAQSGDIQVTSTVRDYIDWTDPDTSTTQRIQMQVQSDGAGAYQTVQTVVKKQTKLSVQSVIDSFGDWVLDTGVGVTSPTRRAFLDFTHPIAGSGPNGGNPTPPFTTALAYPKLTADCSAGQLSSLAGGATTDCPMRIGFYYPIGSSTLYRIHMTPDSRSVFPYPEVDFADVTCSGVDANLNCNHWTIEPNGTKGGCVTSDCAVKQNVVKLVKIVTVRGQLTEVNMGDFYMTFSVDVTKP